MRACVCEKFQVDFVFSKTCAGKHFVLCMLLFILHFRLFFLFFIRFCFDFEYIDTYINKHNDTDDIDLYGRGRSRRRRRRWI